MNQQNQLLYKTRLNFRVSLLQNLNYGHNWYKGQSILYQKQIHKSSQSPLLQKFRKQQLISLYQDLSNLQSQYLAKNRSRQKDLTHLSTLLQRDQTDNIDPQDQNIEQVKCPVSKSLSVQPKPFQQDDFLTMFSNPKLNKTANHHIKSTKHQVSQSKDGHKTSNTTCNKLFNQTEEKFFNITLEKKLTKPNNLSTMFKQKWSQNQLKKAEEKIQSTLKTTLNFNSQIFELRQQARLKHKQLTKKSKHNSKQKEKSTHQDFLFFVEQRKKLSLQGQKIKDSKSQKLFMEGKVVYETSENDIPQNREIKGHSTSQIHTSKRKVSFKPFRTGKLFEFVPLEKTRSNHQKQALSKRLSQSKNNSIKMISKKRKCIFLPRENEEQFWWSKQQIVNNAGYNFQLNKTLIL